MKLFSRISCIALPLVTLLVTMMGLPGRCVAAESLTLERALEIAIVNSPDIVSTRLDLERSNEELKAQKASLKSQLSLTLNPINYNRDRQFNQLFSAWNNTETKSSGGRFTLSQPIIQTDGTLILSNNFDWRDSYSDFQDVRNKTKTYSNNTYISYTQPLFTYNRTRFQTRELELSLESTRLTYAVQQLSIESQVTQGFYSLFQNQVSLDIDKEELANRQASFEIIKNKVDAGLVAREELYQAELDLTTSRSGMQNSEMQLQNALDQFKHLIGISLDEEISVDANISWQPVEVDLEKAVSHGLEKRMELRQHEISIETARYALTQTEALNEFRGGLTLTYGITGNDESFSDMFEKSTRTQRVNLQFDVPLWDWGERAARVNASRASIRKARVSAEIQRDKIIIGIREAWREFQNQISQIELARQGLRQAELTYDINMERYKNGDLTSMDLNLQQNQLSQKKIALVQAQINYRLSLLSLKIESLYDFEKRQSVLDEVLQRTESK